MKKMITEYIRKNKAVSYVELERLFDKYGYEYKGDMMSCSDYGGIYFEARPPGSPTVL